MVLITVLWETVPRGPHLALMVLLLTGQTRCCFTEVKFDNFDRYVGKTNLCFEAVLASG